MVKILFVCLGNICRSPTAHGVFEAKLAREGLSNSVVVDSAGTGAWHSGHSPDHRAQEAAKKRGYDLSHIKARPVEIEDFECFDYLLAMDKKNLDDLLAQSPEAYKDKIKLFLSYGQDSKLLEVPDPYYGGIKGFDIVFELVENACEGLLDEIIKTTR